MHSKTGFSSVAALALATGILLVPGGTFARGAGGSAGATHGPVFGFHPARMAAHRPIAPALVRRLPAHFGSGWWRLHRSPRHRDDASAFYPVGGDGGYAGPADPNDVTGAFAGPGPGLVPLPPAYPPEHAGCIALGYNVPGETGGIARVTVTRC